MSLEYAILGFLNYHPYTRLRPEENLRHFHPAFLAGRPEPDLPHPGAADRAGFDRKWKRSPQDDRPDRKVYSHHRERDGPSS